MKEAVSPLIMEKQPLLVLALDGVIAKAGFNEFQNPANHLA